MEDNWQTVLQRLSVIDQQIGELRGHFDKNLDSFKRHVNSKIALKSIREIAPAPDDSQSSDHFETPHKVRIVRITTPPQARIPANFQGVMANAPSSFAFGGSKPGEEEGHSASAEETAAVQPAPELLERVKATANGNENAAAVVYYVFQWAAERAPGASWNELVSQYAYDVRTPELIANILRADLSQIGEEQRKEVESQLFSNESVPYDTPSGMSGKIFRYPPRSFEQTWFDWL